MFPLAPLRNPIRCPCARNAMCGWGWMEASLRLINVKHGSLNLDPGRTKGASSLQNLLPASSARLYRAHALLRFHHPEAPRSRKPARHGPGPPMDPPRLPKRRHTYWEPFPRYIAQDHKQSSATATTRLCLTRAMRPFRYRSCTDLQPLPDPAALPCSQRIDVTPSLGGTQLPPLGHGLKTPGHPPSPRNGP